MHHAREGGMSMPQTVSLNEVSPGTPKRVLSTRDGLVLVVGLIIGAGIFRSPPLVAGNVGDGTTFLLLWILGGVIALIGALCYAELASTYPHAGGEYHVLGRAFGSKISFLLGWSRLSVLQTGSIALLGFLFADYAVRVVSFGSPAAETIAVPVLASLVIVVFTLVNLAGLHPGRRTQYLLTSGEFLGLTAVIGAGILVALGSEGASAQQTGVSASESPNLGLALVFVLLTYGGWSEAAYLSAEFRDERRGVQRMLIGGVAIITLLYLLVNIAYLSVLGRSGVASSEAVAVDVMQAALGAWGGIIVGIIVMIAALSSINSTIITGARGSYAVGKDVSPLNALGVWHPTQESDSGAPRKALIVQAMVSLILVAFGAATRSGFETMVAYTAPVFWLTLFLMGIALFVLRWQDPLRERPFRVPLYPVTPLLFCATSAYMFYSSVMYAGKGALFGVVVMLLGIPLLVVGRARARQTETASGAFESVNSTS